MYVSGPPLHVISMNLMQRFREDLGFEFPVSFSAGIDVKNFPGAVACGMVPVTTCTDLLRQGGFGRLPGYLRSLGREMEKCGVRTREAFVLAARGHGASAAVEALASLQPSSVSDGPSGDPLREIALSAPNDLPAALRDTAASAGIDPEELVLRATRVAGRLNGRDIVPGLVDEPRYHSAANSKPPRQIDSQLALYDCINCDLCIQACPNDAIFAYEVAPVELDGFVVTEEHQLAVFEGACNDCSNCEVYCPEKGAPFVEKEMVFLNAEAFERSTADGFVEIDGVLHARMEGKEYRLEMTSGDLPREDPGGDLDAAGLWRMRTVWESIFRSPTPNPVNPAPQ
jgi:putative selenate reductase